MSIQPLIDAIEAIDLTTADLDEMEFSVIIELMAFSSPSYQLVFVHSFEDLSLVLTEKVAPVLAARPGASPVCSTRIRCASPELADFEQLRSNLIDWLKHNLDEHRCFWPTFPFDDWSLQQWHYTVLLSGALIYPWWVRIDSDVRIDALGPYVLSGVSRDEPEPWASDTPTVKRLLTPAVFRNAVRLAYKAVPAVQSLDLYDPECYSDFDAEIADCVLQCAVYGEVLFS